MMGQIYKSNFIQGFNNPEKVTNYETREINHAILSLNYNVSNKNDDKRSVYIIDEPIDRYNNLLETSTREEQIKHDQIRKDFFPVAAFHAFSNRTRT